MTYRVSFRHEDQKFHVLKVDETGFVHLAPDADLAGRFPEDAVPELVRLVLETFGPCKVIIDPVEM